MNKPFSFIHDLFRLSDAERAMYAADASEYFGLPRELNALDFITMDDGTGLRKLVLYARKGTADLLRDIHGIEVVSLTPCHTTDFAAFTAVGRNKAGRQEIAVGSCSIQGLKGERLSSAVMTAQTRALRRLTLQFVGGGLLDESEVNSQIADIRSSGASLAQLAGDGVVMPPMPQPVNRPNPSPGLDTTAVAGLDTSLSKVSDAKAALDAMIPEGGMKKRTRRKSVDIASPGQTVAQNSLKEGVSLREIVAAVKAMPELSPSDDILECMRTATASPLPVMHSIADAEEMGAKVVACAMGPASIIPEQAPVQTSPFPLVEAWGSKREPDLPEVPEVKHIGPRVPAEALLPAKFEEYRNGFRRYANEVLPKEGGMTNSNGMGITSKLRKFAEQLCGATVLTEEQWVKLFGFLDGYYNQNGAVKLVAYIEKAINVS
jgi:hypothetical protein